jgi:lipopolysaccharide/colanic/teichoic acid biosynthesis glycosyltransferase
VIFLGASPAVFELANHLKTHPGLGLFPVGYLDQAPVPGKGVTLPWLGPTDQYLEIVDAQEPAWIIIGRPENLRPWWVDDFLELRFGGVQVELVDTLFEESLGRVCIKQMRPADLIYRNPFETTIAARFQAALAAGTALLLIVLLSPILLLIALLARLSSAEPVLTRTRVTGLHGIPFTLYRFCCTSAEVNGEHRMTPLGRFLRHTGLECLPHLFNLVVGDMAFIGPCPERVEYADRLKELLPFYSQRHTTRPGLIGWAKLKSTLADDTLRTLEYDLYYIKNIAQNTILSIDLLVLGQTIKLPWR